MNIETHTVMGPVEHDGQVGSYDFLSHKPIWEIIQSLQLHAALSKYIGAGGRYAQLVHALRHNHSNFHFVEANRTLSVVIAVEISHEFFSERAPFALSKVLHKVVYVNLSILLR